jgi:hypothetical protein
MRRDDASRSAQEIASGFSTNVLAGATTYHLIGVIVVPGGNDDELEFGIVEDRVRIAREASIC